MVRAGAVLIALWAGSCVGLNGQELGLAFGSSMTDMADVNLGADALPQVSAEQGTSKLSPRDEEDLGFNALLKRQRGYCPSGSHMCSGGRCCQNGWDCMGDGTCCPSGQKRCGNSKCYNPQRSKCCTGPGTVWGCDLSNTCCTGGFCRKSSEQCCRNGSCDRDATCCENECCLSGAYCGSDGYCQLCPPTTRTVTSTTSGTTTTTRTVTAEGDPAESAPEFSCVPMTATNAEGATLELGDDCALKYKPPPTGPTSSTGLAARAAPTPETSCPFASETEAPTLALAPRQDDCTPIRTITRTEWRTRGTTRTATVTRRAREPAEEGFSCPTMEATNAVGGVLALDESCGLAFTPAEPTAASEDEEDDARPGRSLGMAVVGPVVAVWAVWLLV